MPPVADPLRPAARIQGLSLIYPGGVLGLERLDLEIRRGETTALLGPNGSGKSTLLKLLAAGLRPTRGTLEVLPELVASPAVKRARIGYVSQEPALDPEMSGFETLSLFAALHCVPRRRRAARIAEIIEKFQMTEQRRRPIATYSGGVRRRLHLALAILPDPDLLLLDEPTTHLDPQARALIWALVDELRNTGRTVVVATHDLADVPPHCQRAIILNRGAIIADDSPRQLAAVHGGPRTVLRLDAPVERPEEVQKSLQVLPGVRGVRILADEVVVETSAGARVQGPLLEALSRLGLEVREMNFYGTDLASAYFALTGHPPGHPPTPAAERAD